MLNDDTRTHNVRIFDPRFDFNSGAQEPREAVSIGFPVAGTFEAFCGIHPVDAVDRRGRMTHPSAP